MGALAVDGKSTTMTQALVTADLDLALDVLSDIATEITFDLHLGIDMTPNTNDLFVGQITNSSRAVDAE